MNPIYCVVVLWEMSFVLETGFGRSANYQKDETDNPLNNKTNSAIIPAGAGLSLNMQLPPIFHIHGFRWFGINAIAGYPAIIYQEDNTYDYKGP